MATKIEYNNKTIATLSAGQMATLACSGKKMKSDISVTTDESCIPIEISTESEMSALLTAENVGKIYKYTGQTGTYENGALYVVESDGTTEEGESGGTTDTETEITDLTGTTWYFNETIELLSNGTIFKLDFDTATFPHPHDTLAFWNDVLAYDHGDSGNDYTAYNPQTVGWVEETDRTITITGGTDATNVDLIAWLQANATQIKYELSGTWVFNEVLTAPSKIISADFNFRFDAWPDQYLEGGSHYPYEYGMLIEGSPYPSSPIEGDVWWLGYEYLPEHVEQRSMYESVSGWISDNYRTITFVGTQTVSKEFYDWFTANAVRQVITFTIDGTTYQAESGMTWGEWVESEYGQGFVVYNGTIITTEDYESSFWQGKMICTAEFNDVADTEVIVADATYVYTQNK